MVVIEKKGQSADELADRVFALFQLRGYKLEEGTKLKGVYGNGSAAMRVLVGGLAKRNKFSISIEPNANNGFNIVLDKAMSGAMGGLIGVSKMDKEFNQVQMMLTSI